MTTKIQAIKTPISCASNISVVILVLPYYFLDQREVCEHFCGKTIYRPC